MANRSDREQGQPNLSLRRHSLNNRMGPCSRTPSGPAVSTDCINRPDRRLHPTNATASIYLLQRGSHPQRTSADRASMSEKQRKNTIHIAMRRNVGFTGGPPQLLREVDMSQRQSIRDASHLYEVERRVQHAARPGFRIMELQLSPTQKVPWHSHTNITDTFYVLEGHMRLFVQDPKEEVNLKPGEIQVVRAARPHLVTNGGTKSLTFLVLQGVGEYDYVPLTSARN